MATSHSNKFMTMSAPEFYDRTGKIRMQNEIKRIQKALVMISCSQCELAGLNEGCIDKRKCGEHMYEKLKEHFEAAKKL